MKHKCVRCKSDMDRISLEAHDTFWIHVHQICQKDDGHPYFCETESRWIGK